MKHKGWILGFVLSGLLSPVAFAGIYKCVDAQGRTAFSQNPCPDASIKGTDRPHQLWRSMRAMVIEGRKLSTNLQADIESIRQCQNERDAYHGKLDAIKTEVHGMALHHEHLYRAHEYLYQCGECRYAALSYCDKANEQLDEAMANLE